MKTAVLSVVLALTLPSLGLAKGKATPKPVTEEFLMHTYSGVVMVETRKSFQVAPVLLKFRRDHTVVVTSHDKGTVETQGWRLDAKKRELEFINEAIRINPEDAEAHYRELIQRMDAGYRASDDPVAADYRNWTRYNLG